MRTGIILTLIYGLSVFFSSAVFAHTPDSGAGQVDGFLHYFTGEHLVMLVLGVVCVVFIRSLYHRFR